MKHPKPKLSATPIEAEVVPANDGMPLSKGIQKKLALAPMTIAGTWDGARQWIAHAKRAHELALFCQVMVGFELLAIRERHGETRGRPRLDGAASPESSLSFPALAQKETGLSERTVWRLVTMADGAVPKLRKHSELLRGFDPSSQSLAALPAPQLEALSNAVRKLTDGITQQDFLVELGLAKAPQGSATTGGHRGRKAPLPIADQVAIRQQLARDDWQLVFNTLATSGTRFLLLEDIEVRSQIDILETHLKARREWVSTPKDKRKPAAIEALLTAAQPTLG